MVSPAQRILSRSYSRRRVLRGASIGGAGLAAAALIGCGDEDEAGGGTGTSQPTAGGSTATSTAAPGGPREGGTVQLSYNIEPTIWDPIISEASPPATYAAPLYPHLFVTKITEETDGNYSEPEPDLVESWEQPDDTTYIFTIHKNGKWGPHPALNGRAITAEDVAFSLERLRSDASVIRGNFEPIDTIEAVDDSTVKVTLKHPFAPLIPYLSDTSAAIEPPEVVDTLTELGTAQQVHGGPWTLEEYNPAVRVVFKRNPDYYLWPIPYVDLTINLITDSNQTAAAFESRQILVRSASANELERLTTEHPELKVGHSGGAHYSHFFNQDIEPWGDPRVRQALRLATDFEAYRKVRFSANTINVLETPARAWLTPYALSQEELAKLYVFNVQEAKRLLDAAGHPDGFDAGTLLAFPLGQGPVDAILPIVEQLRANLNVRFQVEQIEYSDHANRFKAGNYQTGTFVYSRRYPEVDQYLWPRLHSTGTLNYARGSDAKLDDLLQKQREEADPEARIETLHEIQRYFISDLNWFIVHPTSQGNSVWWPELRGYTEHVAFGQYAHRKSWLEV